MAARFFRSIPQSVTIRDPYEEVFMLFTTETAETPWAHNRSVSQTSTRLEVELDFTPAPSPAVSQPGSRPESRGSFNPAVSNMNPQSQSPTSSSLGPGAGALVPSSGSSNGYAGSVVGARSQLSLESPTPITGLIGPGSGSVEPISRPVSDPDPSAGTVELYNGEQGINISSSSSPIPAPPRSRALAARAMMANRKTSRKLLTDSATVSSSTSKQPGKKPVVIHQSLSTLSQPGQTGTVVWDSSILMAKFLLSIKGLHTRCYLAMEGDKKNKIMGNIGGRRLSLQEQQVRQLEAQAKHLTVGANGELQETGSDDEEDDDDDEQEGDDNATDSSDDERDDDNDQDDNHRSDPLVFDPAQTTILELGSGCGLLGIVLADFCKELLLTDQAPVLPLLVKNLRKNLDKKYFEDTQKTPSPKKSQSSPVHGPEDSVKPCHIQVQELVWGQELDQDLKRGLGVDFVIATDVVYNESVVPKLVQTLKDLCEIRQQIRKQVMSTGGAFGKGVPQRTVVLLGQELRTDYVHLAFLEGLEQAGFRMVRIPRRMMETDYQSGYVIYAFYLIN